MTKRMIDVVGGGLLLVVATPLIAVAAAISVAAYRRGPVFAQQRVGRGGRPFRLLKIRTLDPATPAALPKAALVAHAPGRACGFLRGHHLDELPQLLNVLGGSMSLVGPRPEMVELHDELPEAFAAQRVEVRPGITGLWQISRAVEGMIPDHPEYDRHYVLHSTLRLDLWILWRTAAGLLGGRPIVSLDEVPAWTAASASGHDAPVDGVAA